MRVNWIRYNNYETLSNKFPGFVIEIIKNQIKGESSKRLWKNNNNKRRYLSNIFKNALKSESLLNDAPKRTKLFW